MESISIFDIYKIGIGPSSSHTIGPWKAALDFISALKGKTIKKVNVELFGSLSRTGKGHGTDVAVQLGLSGHLPNTIDPDKIQAYLSEITSTKKIKINSQTIDFEPNTNIGFQSFALDYHPNGIKFFAEIENENIIEATYFSVGGGFIEKENQENTDSIYAFVNEINSGKDIIELSQEKNCSIADLVLENELSILPKEQVEQKIIEIWETMQACVFRGCKMEGTLPGGLKVTRRAKKISGKLLSGLQFNNIEDWLYAIKKSAKDFNSINNWISCWALAVNEENASFGRVVTSPTNGAAGVIPAVFLYHKCFGNYKGEQDIFNFFLTSSEIGSLFKKGATISAAAGGCQAEIGVSSAMAAAGLTAINGGTPAQVLEAAEIAMEHHLGLTCDPIGGLVQVPCIERNSMGAIKAITASNLALNRDTTTAIVSLDNVIKTMWQTAQDMNTKYKETAAGGLAINIPVVVPEC